MKALESNHDGLTFGLLLAFVALLGACGDDAGPGSDASMSDGATSDSQTDGQLQGDAGSDGGNSDGAKSGCGDGIVTPPEACDVGDADEGGGCSADCSEATCLVPVTHETIQAALDDTACPDVFISSGTYIEEVKIARDVSVYGVGAEPPVLEGPDEPLAFSMLRVVGEMDAPISVALFNLTIQNSQTQTGLAAYDAELEATNLLIQNNKRGIELHRSDARLRMSRVLRNIHPGKQLVGAILVEDSTLGIEDSEIAENESTHDIGGGGGAIALTNCDAETMTLGIQRSLVRDNILKGWQGMAGTGEGGAGVWGDQDCSAWVDNSTFVGNKADERGGALNMRGPTLIYNTTIVGNEGGSVGGVLIRDIPLLHIENSVVAGNMGKQCERLGKSEGDYNVWGDDNLCSAGANDLKNVSDVKLGELADNGGPTQTMKPAADSPLVNAGNPDGCKSLIGVTLDVDQRGLPRPVGGRCDIGAVEVQ